MSNGTDIGKPIDNREFRTSFSNLPNFKLTMNTDFLKNIKPAGYF
jgi:hypothetical protein